VTRPTLKGVPGKRILLALAMLLIALTLISITLGREIYSGKQPGLASFGIIHFAGYLFFLLMPVEALVPYYQGEGHAGPILIAIALVSATLAQLIDYGIGHAVSQEAVQRVVGTKRYARAQRALEKHGRWAIFLFNLLPLSSPNLILVAGLLRFGMWRTIVISMMGLTVKYIGIVYVYSFF